MGYGLASVVAGSGPGVSPFGIGGGFVSASSGRGFGREDAVYGFDGVGSPGIIGLGGAGGAGNFNNLTGVSMGMAMPGSPGSRLSGSAADEIDFLLALSSDEKLLTRLNEVDGAETVSTSGKGTDAKWKLEGEEVVGVLRALGKGGTINVNVWV